MGSSQRGCLGQRLYSCSAAWLISERNGEREPSREEHRVYRREGAGWEEEEEEMGERSPAPAPCERSKCSFHLQQELRQHQTDFEHTGWSFGGIDTKDQTASSRSSLRLHVQLFCSCRTLQHSSSLSFGELRSPQRGASFWHNCSALRHLHTGTEM